MAADRLRQALLEAVARSPGSTARELAREIRRAIPAVSKRDLNPLLYHSPDAFRNDGGYVPRWFAAGSASAMGDPKRRANTDSIRAMLARQDALSTRSKRTPTTPAHCTAPMQPPRIVAASNFVTRTLLDWADPPALSNLRPWQHEALGSWYAAGGRGVVEAVTGTGKTHLGLEATCQMARRGGRSTVLVPSIELQRQWRRNFSQYAPHLTLATVGGDAGGLPYAADVVIAVVHSAAKLDLAQGGREHLLVADEAHRYGADTFQYSLRNAYRYRLGLTATFERSDGGVGETLLPYFDDVVFRYSYERAVPESVVAPFTLLFAGVSLTDDEMGGYRHQSKKISESRGTLTRAGLLNGPPETYQSDLARARAAGGALRQAAVAYEQATRARRNLLADAVNKQHAVIRMADIISESNGAVIFTQKVEPAEDIAERLRIHGVVASAVHSGMKSEERQAGLDSLRDGSVAALCAPKILDEGIDIPNVDLGIVVSASRGRRQMIQRLGRVIRLKEDGHHARFVMLYAEDTVEDPAEGAQEGFASMVEDVAARRTVLESGWTGSEARHALELPHHRLTRSTVRQHDFAPSSGSVSASHAVEPPHRKSPRATARPVRSPRSVGPPIAAPQANATGGR